MTSPITDIEAQRRGSAASSIDDVPLTVLSSSTASLGEAPDDQDDDAHDQHDASKPLLPRHRPSSPLNGENKEPRLRQLVRVAFFACLFLLASISVLAVLLFSQRHVTHPATAASQSDQATLASPFQALSSTERFLHDPSSLNNGLIPFPASAFSPSRTPQPLEHSLSTSSWPSPSCLETFVSSGILCAAAHHHWAGEKAPKFDVVWTWVNGSSAELMADWREKVSEEVGRFRRAKRWIVEARRRLGRRASGASVVKHFREHDELRFSIRSVLSSLPSSTLSSLHLIVGDTPAYSPSRSAAPVDLGNFTFDPASTRLAQVPHWVALQSLEFASLPAASDERKGPSLRVHPHSELFKAPAGEGGEEAAVQWQASVLPSFNSLAIESQLPNLDGAASTALYLNDDFFLMQPLTLTDLSSPLTGPVFRMQRDLLVGGVSPSDTHDDPDGEWRSLGYTAWLLDERFGKRRRPYLVHVAKTMEGGMLREVQRVFGKELMETASARFRGKAALEVQTMYLLTMYTIEKHREALLWSFLIARCDTDRSGTYSPSERHFLLASLGQTPSSDSSSLRLSVPLPRRASLSSFSSSRAFGGLPEPNQTTIECSSADGYALIGTDEGMTDFPALKGGWSSFSSSELPDGQTTDPVCTLDLPSCFGNAFLSPSSLDELPISPIFCRIALEKPQCGDCLVTLLMGKSGEKGVEAFLPPRADGDEEADETEGAVEAEAIGLGGTKWGEVDFARGLEGRKGSLRRRASTLIHRYAYTIGSSPASFQSIKYSGPALSSRLNDLSRGENRPAFVALNDDLTTTVPAALEDVDRRMREWFEEVWPVASPWERAGA
ncbi:hypothetical protein JCM6882_005645 [Rhodosporidiobolus microsporus]